MLSGKKIPVTMKENDNSKPANPRSRIFRPCLTCRRRKISCDKTRPKCKRCAQTGYQCEGYGEERHFVYVTPTRAAASSNSTETQKAKKVTLRSSRKLPPDQQLWQYQNQLHPQLSTLMNSAGANRLQILSYFLERYLPGQPSQQREDKTALTWIRSLPQSLGKWNFLDMALSALSLAYIGDSNQDASVSRQAEYFYNEALKHVRARLFRNQIDEGILATCMCMSMYELFHTTDGGTNGWMFHVKGASRLLEIRGPPSETSPLDMNLFRRIRAATLWDSYASGKPTFLAKLEWRGLSDAPYDQLMDTLVCLPSLLAKADQIETMVTRGDDHEAAAASQKLLRKCHILRDELVTWYADFQSKETGPLFYLEPEERHPYLDPDSDLNDLFPDSVTFQTPYIAQILMLYWYGEVVVHSIMSHVHVYIGADQTPKSEPGTAPSASSIITTPETTAQIQQQTTMEDETIANIETIGDYFASKICQAMAGCGRNSLQGYGFQIALVPLWAAQEYYFSRSPRKYIWCQTVLTNFSTRGFVVAQNLGQLPLRQYPGRYIERNSPIEELEPDPESDPVP